MGQLITFTLGSLVAYGVGGVMSHLANFSLSGVLAVMFLAYVASFVGYTGWGYLLARHSASKVTPFIMLVPVIALVVGYVALKERLILWHYVGILTVLFGLGVHLLGGRWFDKKF
ncbi:EamA family transporter [Moraxella bovis]|uniref:EamA family transporter n=1 Tax=Moraxella bovis TaxID=476 RepID=A0AAX3ET92_MORBO|nr:EamA family transporter [Moraxella bovis]UYZ75376.1 EamA family transporter [Moraxella bovis]UYZ78691.1 EamA family transporter [Moraxella bovis]UYZ87173.1 EamA family transporter [Moraxella bovis]UYZ92602.1 EamA family transporter [Moraxella bovis]UYZ97482.1 EamA family transporter [Moraxella bovis]